MSPEIALAASARSWPDRLHRFLLDHGGGVVRSRVMGSDQAAADRYDVLFIDDICSFLTPLLVRRIRELGREIVGVYDPADAPDAKRHLLECGVTDVIEADAGPEEFVAMASATFTNRPEVGQAAPPLPRSFHVGVLGPIGGVGTTEIAIGVAANLARSRATVLLDLDQQSPSVAQRLDLPLHPNLLTAIDAAHHAPSRIGEAMLAHESIDIVGGVPTASLGQPFAPVEVAGLLDEVGAVGYEVLVADLGSPPVGWLDVLAFHVLIVVGVANPVGISRLVRHVQEVAGRDREADLVAVVNRLPGPGTRGHEIKAEMARLLPRVPVVLLPEDRRLEAASWDGLRPGRGPFARSVASVASLIDKAIR